MTKSDLSAIARRAKAEGQTRRRPDKSGLWRAGRSVAGIGNVYRPVQDHGSKIKSTSPRFCALSPKRCVWVGF